VVQCLAKSVYTDIVRKPRLKKGQPKRFRRGNLAKVVEKKRDFLSDHVALWSSHPLYDQDGGVLDWGGEVRVSSHVMQQDILLIISVHNLAHPSKHQYCHVMCFRTNESGWVSSEHLEKIQ